MERRKRWQFWLIVAVLALTAYNILPTIFYYSNPLSAPINEERSEQVAEQIVTRVNSLETESIEWLRSFTAMIGTDPVSIELDKETPERIAITFKTNKDATRFKRFLPEAGKLIPFVPAQLGLGEETGNDADKTVIVSRQIGIHLDKEDIPRLFSFAFMEEKDGSVTPLYREVIFDRMEQIMTGFGGSSKTAQQLQAITRSTSADKQMDDVTVSIAKEIVDMDTHFGSDSEIAKRFYASFTQIDSKDRAEMVQKFLARMDSLKSRLNTEIESIESAQKEAQKNEQLISSSDEQLKTVLLNQKLTLEKAATVVRNNQNAFKAGKQPLTTQEIETILATGFEGVNSQNPVQQISLEGRNPFVESLVLDWNSGTVETRFFSDIATLRNTEETTENEQYLKDRINQLLINDIARAARFADEEIRPTAETFGINLNNLTNPQSFMTLDLGSLAALKVTQFADLLRNSWNPTHQDFKSSVFPVSEYEAYRNLPVQDQKLGLVVYAPSMSNEPAPAGFRSGSIYVIAKGVNAIADKYRQAPEATDSKVFFEDFQKVNNLLQSRGFIGYPGSSYGMASEFSKDYIFELDDYYTDFLAATREDFVVKGTKKYAVLDFTDVEQRILTLNKIGDSKQEDLLKWKEEYQAAQVNTSPAQKFLIPPPTKSPFIENIKLSMRKYVRGDDRKILKWGLDLSGGKTVRIGLRDQNNRPVTNPEDLSQAVDELYTRVNKMGVSERTIHIENNNIILDFPGSQNWSAADLIKASAMHFHIVNEKFTPNNDELKNSINEFLQNVWNEAVVTNRKDVESINEIAWQHLGGDASEGSIRPRSEAATILYDNGLRLANPSESGASSTFNDTLSAVAVMRGDDYTEWMGQSHPLVVVFHNYALEGSSLENVQAGYDPKEGNILNFNVKNSYEGGRSGSPRDDLYAWTSQFSEDKIVGTPKETYSKGNGWRMAVILNDTIISQPTLSAALNSGGMIKGRFTQREINQLAADLKAGSLSFTPKILSEQNVSPELGREERARGIIASIVALTLVVVAMVGYYRFAGIVASCAVLLNLLIMWGVLQNLGAALNLPGIAGIVLTIGMAVDANVLVFERVREEFKVSGRIASAIQAGYRKAFSAIVDSNITTLLAALILIQFDSGPIKGFAVTIMIGIICSMFTSLFMTRYFFAGWVQNPKNKTLSMAQIIGNTSFDFLKQAKKAVVMSAIVLAVGGYLFFAQTNTIFGMDFTGGYSLTLQLQEQTGDPSYRTEAGDALIAKGATSNDFDIRTLTLPNQLRIQLGTSMEEPGHPFHGMAEILAGDKFEYDYQKNPRIVWIVSALEDAGLKVQTSDLETLDNNWTVITGQFSDAMRNNALMALSFALLSILVYITIRFEFKYAVGAVIGLTHDVLMTLGVLAFFHWLGFAVQIDLTVIGALMTIIGYSLNDTIIVFDRIREDLKLMRKMSYADVINHALNVTLSRTLMTSGTTLLVLFTLVLLGGHSIFAFSLVMTIGVLIGTLSSLFVAPAMLLYLHNREEYDGETAKAKG